MNTKLKKENKYKKNKLYNLNCCLRLTSLGFLAMTFLSGCASTLIPEAYILKTPENYQTNLNSDNQSNKKNGNQLKNLISNLDKNEKDRNKMVDLSAWWNQFNDPVLLELIDNAQKNNTSIAQAVVSLKNYESILVSTQARNTPNISAAASTVKSKSQTGIPASTVSQLGLQTSWELDILGANSLAANANEKLLDGATASWHDARVIVSAEVARSYFNYQFCSLSLNLAKRDYESRTQQNDITNLNVQAGFEAKSSLFTSQASLAQAKTNMISQQALCDTQLKSLVALTALEEPILKQKLVLPDNLNSLKELTENSSRTLYLPSMIPGDLITQRPDVYNAMRELEASALEVAVARAENYPKVSISGNIFSMHTASSGVSTTGSSWNIGPLSISLPIFDGGVIKANTALYNQKYEAAKINFDERVRTAVKEVETAFISLNSTSEKTHLNTISVNGYQLSYEAVRAKYEAGLSSLFELEDARRTYLSALNAQVDNQKERMSAWIDLYKALGGGFQSTAKI